MPKVMMATHSCCACLTTNSRLPHLPSPCLPGAVSQSRGQHEIIVCCCYARRASITAPRCSSSAEVMDAVVKTAALVLAAQKHNALTSVTLQSTDEDAECVVVFLLPFVVSHPSLCLSIVPLCPFVTCLSLSQFRPGDGLPRCRRCLVLSTVVDVFGVCRVSRLTQLNSLFFFFVFFHCFFSSVVLSWRNGRAALLQRHRNAGRGVAASRTDGQTARGRTSASSAAMMTFDVVGSCVFCCCWCCRALLSLLALVLPRGGVRSLGAAA